jgi:signal transduction histidine kinase
VLDARRIGTIVLESSLDSLYARMRLRALTIGFILLAASVIALVLSHRLQRLIADPVLRLAEVARAVSAHQNYSLRATSQSRDEIGLLVGAFNEMLSQIERRDAELLSAKETLEQRVSERTAQLQTELKERQRAEAELEDRNLELEQTNRELDDFAYIASHDLKEPLRGIHNYSKFLLEDYGGQLDEDGSAKLHTLIRLSRRLETLIDSLLRYSRLGRAELTLRSVDLNEVVAEVVDTLAITLRERQIDLRIPRTLPTVECDREHIGEVFANLMTNAMKYNDKEKKWIEVGTAEPADPDERVVYVRDNGIGIPERHIEAVFRIFKRLHGRDQFGGGTGAGLTIVRKIVDRHHGRVWIESQSDEGTTVFFSLPKGNVNGGVHGPADPRDRGQS